MKIAAANKKQVRARGASEGATSRLDPLRQSRRLAVFMTLFSIREPCFHWIYGINLPHCSFRARERSSKAAQAFPEPPAFRPSEHDIERDIRGCGHTQRDVPYWRKSHVALGEPFKISSTFLRPMAGFLSRAGSDFLNR